MSDSTDSGIVSIRQAPEAAPSVLAGAERHKILVEWNRTEREYPRGKCLHQLFEEQVERTPDLVAVVFENDSLTYRELNNRANRLANHLRGLGIGPESLVALCLERSLEMIVAILGTLKAGGAYVPIDPAYPADRVAFMLADANAPVLLTQEALRKKLPPAPAKVVCLDSGWKIIERESEAAPASGVTADNLAYVIYTSGSTGRPKGAMNTHRGICNRLLWMQEMYQLTEEDRVLQKTPFSFDISVWELFWPLLTGARLVIARPDGHRDNQYLIRLIISQQITTLHFVPSMLRHFLQETEAGNCLSLRQVFCGGEALPWDLQETFFKRLPGVTLHNLYGPTEAAVDVTHWTCKPNSGLRLVPIGRPIANIQIYILDETHQPVPVGTAGELHIGGVGLARGYLNRPELTAERFITNPFSNKPDARLYRTGDLARWLPDGDIEFLGRMDQQVKIRGFRIELDEIGSVLCQHPDLRAAAVTAQPDGVNEMELAAFVVARDASALSVNSLRQWLAEKLPDYMIPSRFVAISALPLTPNGKLDRKALAKLDGAELASGTDYLAPRNELEQKLAEIWQSVLRRERVGIRDNFFNLGGHSLLAVMLCSQIKQRFGGEVPLRWVFEHPTIERLSAQMKALDGQRQRFHPIEKADRKKPLPMSFAQQRMWLLQQILPEVATYNEPVAWRLSGRVDREKVRRALQVIQKRHEVLRTALVQQDGNLLQQIFTVPEVTLPWHEMDLKTVPQESKQSVLEEQLLTEARRPFDLAQVPLWRAVWIELAADEHVLAFTFHHSIVDEWSLRLFFKELDILHAADGQPEPARLLELPAQYSDYAVWEKEHLTGEILEMQREYWREQLQNLPPPLELPTNLPRPVQQSGRGAVHRFQLAGMAVTHFRELAREEKTTLFTVGLAAFHLWLLRNTGQKDIVVGTPITQRHRLEFHSLVGFFLNTLPIRARLEDRENFREVVQQVRETLLGAFGHAELPFEQMVALAVKERVAGQQPLYQVMFVLLEEGLPPLHLDQAHSRLMPMGTGTSKNDLTLNIQAVGETWDCQLEYATDLFSADDVARMARDLTELFRTIAENSRTSFGQLRLLPEAERRQILVEWNATEREYPRDKCIHQLFEEQAERTPDAVAVVFEKDSLTYRELNSRANRLANHLRGLGIGPESLVALCLERSLEMIVAILGTLKAGGAYVPIDPAYPADRVVFMLADANAPVLLTQEALRKKLPTTPAKVICLDSGWKIIERESETAPASGVTADNLAYVIYTSGSTGKPKGVLITHYNVVRLMRATADWFHFGEQDVWTMFHSYAFDFSVWEIWGALLHGGRLVVVPYFVSRSPGEFYELLAVEKVTVLNQTPSAFRQLIQAELSAGATRELALRYIIFGGEALRMQSLKPWFERHGDARPQLLNMYGITETTVHVTYRSLTKKDVQSASVIGVPIPDLQVYILDSHGKPVSVGVPGEMFVGGAGLARGYLNQPKLTAERFIPHPFSDQPDARLYRTGDLARWLPDADIEYLGRIDYQVKIRGFRVELGEIEAVLCAQPEIREAVVVLQDDPSDDKRLAAYLVSNAGEKPDASAMRARLVEKLPDYMIPAAFVWLDQLPLTSNGKVDRKALPAPKASVGNISDESSQPINLLELELTRIWRRFFQREDIGKQDNFFALGGHSLMAARMAAEIDKRLGCKLPIAALFQSPTIESLARRLTDEKWVPLWSSLVPLQPQGSKPPLFLVHGWGGDVYVFLELAKLLPLDQPTYGIQAVGLDGKATRHITIEEMAAHYVKEIISFQPDGPVYLTGYSMGGLIAYEIAQQLHRRNRRVAMLALLDSAPVGVIPWGFYALKMMSYIPERCLFHLRRWLGLPLRERYNYFLGRWKALRYWLFQNVVRAPAVTNPPPKENQAPKVPGFEDYYVAVASAYRLRPYSGSADIFIGNAGNSEWKGYWRYMVRGGASFHRVEGRHEQLIFSSEHVAALAKALATVLQRAQENERTSPVRKEHTHASLVS